MSLKALVNSPEIYNSLIKYLEEKITLLHKTLEQTTEPPDFYKVQGEIKALRRLLTIRDEVNKGGK